MKETFERWKNISLIKKIILGLIVGVCLGIGVPQWTIISILGQLFVGALKSIAPLLVFFIVMSALANHKKGKKTNMGIIALLYVLSTFTAGLTAVIAIFLFPVQLTLVESAIDIVPPQGVGEVLKAVLLKTVDNPIDALIQSNYIGILAWSVIFGLGFQTSSKEMKASLKSISEMISIVIEWIISFAPLGVMGLVYEVVAKDGVSVFLSYGELLVVLLGTMLVITFIVNPLVSYLLMRENPYPLIWKCLTISGVTAFFTRSSAANIPINMQLCEELGLDEDTYSVSIPLGATINMSGAAITISILTVAAAQTVGIQIDFLTAVLLSVLATISACGASGVTGGSLLLIPVSCSLFGIPNDIAMQVVGIGFIIGVLQDACETALNSSTDVLFTAVAEKYGERKQKSLS
ncbi:serine/threonine transporter [Granulicatella balaenopterae]|uniref:Serine/threonine transporter SstT n=1 Tax=Granulicatella balaenopterae TaxID=137733 RepID=A0A1H9NCQ6_9LACT|nr:serine/threonine transporter SstT [Granulicatella balaenopterae]SER33153.1 serine/threonine transporter [Granulicatella balaenopterae]